MPERYEVYHCVKCGNVAEIMVGGRAPLHCCGEPMIHKVGRSEDTGLEKHVPVIEKADGGYLVKVGSDPHAMTEEHHIVMIELHEGDGKVQRQYLEIGAKPEAFFPSDATEVTAREYCNLHGLWLSQS